MSKIEDRNTATDATVGARKSRKSQSLRLEKQTIRTLTGAELTLVGGAGGNCDGACPTVLSIKLDKK